MKIPDLGVLHALAGGQRREVKGFAPAHHHQPVAKVVIFLDSLGVVVTLFPRTGILCGCPVGSSIEVFHVAGDV